MKVSVTFKTPDAIRSALQDSQELEDLFNEQQNEQGTLDAQDYSSMIDEYEEKFRKWVSHGELITVDFDLEAGTATVRERT